jgi:hypothetical protein
MVGDERVIAKGVEIRQKKVCRRKLLRELWGTLIYDLHFPRGNQWFSRPSSLFPLTNHHLDLPISASDCPLPRSILCHFCRNACIGFQPGVVLTSDYRSYSKMVRKMCHFRSLWMPGPPPIRTPISPV